MRPERFGLAYVGAGGQRQRPVMLHRALFGSLERFLGILLDHHGLARPPWLAPDQVVVLPVTAAQPAPRLLPVAAALAELTAASRPPA